MGELHRWCEVRREGRREGGREIVTNKTSNHSASLPPSLPPSQEGYKTLQEADQRYSEWLSIPRFVKTTTSITHPPSISPSLPPSLPPSLRPSQEGYQTLQEADSRYSEWLSIPRSIKTTSIKPSGTVSLLAGATPGMHFPESRFYIRRVRIASNSELLLPLKEAGYVVEPAVGDLERTSVVEIPVDVGEGIRTLKEVGMWEQLAFAAFLQRHWADNQVCALSLPPSLPPSFPSCVWLRFRWMLGRG